MSTTLTSRVEPRVWIGCLSCYNGGRLVGDWYDADIADLVTPEDLHGGATQHEELWVMDHENFLGTISGECSPSYAAEIARILKDLSPEEAGAFATWMSELGTDVEPDRWVERFRDEFRGSYESQAHFAQEWAEVTAEPEDKARMRVWPFNSINWERAADELFSGGFHAEPASGGGVYVFCPR